MMKYFAIEHSLDKKIMGNVEQIKKVIHHCHVDDNKDFIDNFPFTKIKINPILSNPVLYDSAHQTDLINAGGVGFSFGSIVISDKFKKILDEFNCYGNQFFSTYIVQKNISNHNYWQTHIYEFPFEFIDFKKSKFSLKNIETRKLIEDSIEVFSSKDFLKRVDLLEYPIGIILKKVIFIAKINIDFFFLRFFEDGGSNGIVSERLKTEIEKQQCTGIEFRPIELSLQDWYDGGVRESVYGKSW